MESILHLLQLRREEAPTALLMSAYFFFALACTSIIKSLQNSFYLSSIGFDWRLPVLYVTIALLSGPIVISYRALASKHSRLALGSVTILAIMGSMILFFVLFQQQAGWWVFPLFYIWGGVFTVLLPIQGWIVSYDLYHTREAKRLYALLGTGGILGGATGGFYTAWRAGDSGNEILLLHGLVLLAVALLTLTLVFRRNPDRLRASWSAASDESEPGRGGSDTLTTLGRVWGSPYLRNLAVLMLVTGAATTMIDLLYKWALEQRYPGSEQQIAQFFGALLGFMFVFSAVLQLLGTSRFLKRWGVGAGLLVMPIGLSLGAVGVGMTAAFWAIILLKAIDGGLRSSLDRTSVELLYVPLGSTVTAPIKSLIDLGANRVGDGLGAAVLLGVTLSLASPVQLAGVLILVACLVWFASARALGGEYRRMLRRSLVSVRASPGQFSVTESIAEDTLLEALSSNNELTVQFALQNLIEREAQSLQEELAFTTQSEAAVQSQLTGIHQAIPGWLQKVEELVTHSDPEAAAAALHLAQRYRPRYYRAYLEEAFSRDEPPPQRILLYLDRYGDEVGPYLTADRIGRWQEQLTSDQAVLVARLMSRTRDPRMLPFLRSWIRHPERRRAIAAIRALAKFRDPDHLDEIFELLEHAWSRKAAHSALISYGEPVVGRLKGMLTDPGVELQVRREIPNVLASIDSPEARDGLVAALYLPDAMLSFYALKELARLRGQHKISYEAESFMPVIQIWVRQYYELVYLRHQMAAETGLACRLLQKAVQERIDWKVEKIFMALGLFLPQEDASISYFGYTSDQRRLRENAIELIDSIIVRSELRKTLLPIFGEEDDAAMAENGRRLFGFPTDVTVLLSDILGEGDAWLKCCIIAAAASRRMESLKAAVRRAADDASPLVRETAEWALSAWGQASAT